MQDKPQAGKKEPKQQDTVPQLVQAPQIIYLPFQRYLHQCCRFLLLLQGCFSGVSPYQELFCQYVRIPGRISVNDRDAGGT